VEIKFIQLEEYFWLILRGADLISLLIFSMSPRSFSVSRCNREKWCSCITNHWKWVLTITLFAQNDSSLTLSSIFLWALSFIFILVDYKHIIYIQEKEKHTLFFSFQDVDTYQNCSSKTLSASVNHQTFCITFLDSVSSRTWFPHETHLSLISNKCRWFFQKSCFIIQLFQHQILLVNNLHQNPYPTVCTIGDSVCSFKHPLPNSLFS